MGAKKVFAYSRFAYTRILLYISLSLFVLDPDSGGGHIDRLPAPSRPALHESVVNRECGRAAEDHPKRR